MFGTEAASFEGDGDHGPVRSVRTADGQDLPADFVVVAAGAELNLELPQAMGLEIDPQEGADLFEHRHRPGEKILEADPQLALVRHPG